MEDSQLPYEAVGLPVQGPHRHPGRGGEPPPGLVPLRLLMQPSGMFVDLAQPEAVLGRHSDADIRVPLPDVSRRHCRFAWHENGWRVIDLNSLNGVYVNDQRILPSSLLRDGDVVRVGGFAFRVQFPPEKPNHTEERAVSQNVLRSIADALPEPSQRRAS